MDEIHFLLTILLKEKKVSKRRIVKETVWEKRQTRKAISSLHKNRVFGLCTYLQLQKTMQDDSRRASQQRANLFFPFPRHSVPFCTFQDTTDAWKKQGDGQFANFGLFSENLKRKILQQQHQQQQQQQQQHQQRDNGGRAYRNQTGSAPHQQQRFFDYCNDQGKSRENGGQTKFGRTEAQHASWTTPEKRRKEEGERVEQNVCNDDSSWFDAYEVLKVDGNANFGKTHEKGVPRYGACVSSRQTP